MYVCCRSLLECVLLVTLLTVAILKDQNSTLVFNVVHWDKWSLHIVNTYNRYILKYALHMKTQMGNIYVTINETYLAALFYMYCSPKIVHWHWIQFGFTWHYCPLWQKKSVFIAATKQIYICRTSVLEHRCRDWQGNCTLLNM